MAKIIVLPGYLLREDIPAVVPVLENKEHGDYTEYFDNVRDYYSANRDAIFVVNAPSGKLHEYMVEFEPRNLVFEYSDKYKPSSFICRLEEERGIWRRSEYFTEESFADFLLNTDVNEVELAGECAPWEGSAFGCVGKLYDAIKDKIEARGMVDCIFPLNPYARRLMLRNNPEFEYLRTGLPVDPFDEYHKMFQDLYPTHQFS